MDHRNAPRFVAAYILHRKAREASILHRLAKGATLGVLFTRSRELPLDDVRGLREPACAQHATPP